jgi:putative addiction module antidote
MTKVKLTTVGNSIGVVLPRDVLTRLRMGKGDVLTVVETPRGIELSPYDPEFEKQMDLAEEIMREDRDVLRKLAQ